MLRAESQRDRERRGRAPRRLISRRNFHWLAAEEGGRSKCNKIAALLWIYHRHQAVWRTPERYKSKSSQRRPPEPSDECAFGTADSSRCCWCRCQVASFPLQIEIIFKLSFPHGASSPRQTLNRAAGCEIIINGCTDDSKLKNWFHNFNNYITNLTCTTKNALKGFFLSEFIKISDTTKPVVIKYFYFMIS
jgi:hypothetical protein